MDLKFPADGGLPFGGPQDTIQYNQDLNYVKGRHSIQGGGQLLYIQDNQSYGAYAQASDQRSFQGSASRVQILRPPWQNTEIHILMPD